MHNTTVTFKNLLLVEPGLAEMVINVTGKDKVVSVHVFFAYLKHVFEPLMWIGLFVDIVSVAIEKPKLVRVVAKELRIGSVSEAHIDFLEIWVLFPEAFLTTERWKTRVNADAGPCCEQYCSRVKYAPCGIFHKVSV